MARMPGFAGPSNIGRARSVDFERSINLIPCVKDAGNPKTETWLESAPGFKPFCALASGPVRGMFYQDERCFAVGGGVFSEIFATHTSVARGVVGSDSQVATISSSGSQSFQLLVTSAGQGYAYDLNTNVLTGIADTPVPTSMGAYFNNRFIALKGLSNQFNFSDLVDVNSWPALNVAQVSKTSDNLVAMIADHDELWFFGTKHSQAWYNDGVTPFAPILGSLMEMGAWAAGSCARLDNSTLWVGGNEHGNGVVYRADGYQPRVISTRWVDAYLQGLDRFDNAVAWTYQENGHSFYVLQVPNGTTTPVYDVSTGLWHERGLWNDRTQAWEQIPGRCHAFAFGKHLVGDRSTNTVYEMTQDLYDAQLVLG